MYTEADYSLEACMKSVVFYVETLHENPYEGLGKAIIRAERDPFFNKTMIDAYKKYINEMEGKR